MAESYIAELLSKPPKVYKPPKPQHQVKPSCFDAFPLMSQDADGDSRV
jgi:hypothetical protein